MTSASAASRPLVRLGVVALAVASAATLLSACGAGQVAHTARKTAATQGKNVNVGDIGIRDAALMSSPAITWAEGTDLPLQLALVNLGRANDTLVEVDSELGDVELVDGEYQATTEESAEEHPATPTPTPSESTAEQPAPTPTPAAGGGEGGSAVDLPIGPSQFVPLTGLPTVEAPARYLVIKGISKQVRPGNVVPVTFRFQNAGEITLALRFAPPKSARDREPIIGHGVETESDSEH